MGQRSHRDVLKLFELNENKNTTYQNVWYIAKVGLSGYVEP